MPSAHGGKNRSGAADTIVSMTVGTALIGRGKLTRTELVAPGFAWTISSPWDTESYIMAILVTTEALPSMKVSGCPSVVRKAQ